MDWNLFLMELAGKVAGTYLVFFSSLLIISLLITWYEGQKGVACSFLPIAAVEEALVTTLWLTPAWAALLFLKLAP